MSKNLEKMLALFKEGKLTEKVFNEMEEEEKKSLLKEISDVKEYESLTAHLKEMNDKEDEEDKNPEVAKDAEEKEEEEDEEDAEKDTDTKTKDSYDEMKARVKAEADLYEKALREKMKNINFGTIDSAKDTDAQKGNEELRKAFREGKFSGERGGMNMFEKQVANTNFLSVQLADRLFSAPEVPTRLIDRFYTQRTSGETVRFISLGSASASVVTNKSDTVAYGSGAASTAAPVTLARYASGFSIPAMDINNPNVNLVEVMSNKAVDAIRDKVEVDAVAAVVTNLQSAKKTDIAASKDSGTNNNLNKISFSDLMGFSSTISVVGVNSPQIAAHPSVFRYILSRTDSNGQKLFTGNIASQERPGTIDGYEALSTGGLSDYSALAAINTGKKEVALVSDWGETCGVAFSDSEFRIMSTYNPDKDEYKIGVFTLAKATPILTSQIAALMLDSA